MSQTFQPIVEHKPLASLHLQIMFIDTVIDIASFRIHTTKYNWKNIHKINGHKIYPVSLSLTMDDKCERGSSLNRYEINESIFLTNEQLLFM